MSTHCIRHLHLKTPHDMLSISWEVDGSSGSTQCEAWSLQYEIEIRVRAGYNILTVERA